MNRKMLITLAAVILLGTFLSPSSSPLSAPEATAAVVARPNVILFLTDDQALRDMRALPAVRRLIGQQGTTFTRAFSSYPLCCPARATLLTGQYAHNHGVMGNNPPDGGFPAFRDAEALPVWLQRAGYNTLMLGKYLNGYGEPGAERYIPPGWTHWEVPTGNIYKYLSQTVNKNGRILQRTGYHTDYVRERAGDLVQKYAAGGKPFFLEVGFLAPHEGLPWEPDDPTYPVADGGLKTPAVAREFRNAFRSLTLPAKPSLFEADLSDKPLLQPRLRPRWEFRESYQQRLESLLSVNKAVRGILNALRATGEAGNTLVIFTSDNGFMTGEHGQHGKILGYEESVRVPLLVSGPGIARGVRRAQLVTLADVTSTVLRAAGATATLVQDGRPLQPLSSDSSAGADRSILLEAGPRPESGGERFYTGIRTPDDQSLLVWYTGAVEYYDLREDPFQLHGTVNGRETATRLDGLLEVLRGLRNCAGVSCR